MLNLHLIKHIFSTLTYSYLNLLHHNVQSAFNQSNSQCAKLFILHTLNHSAQFSFSVSSFFEGHNKIINSRSGEVQHHSMKSIKLIPKSAGTTLRPLIWALRFPECDAKLLISCLSLASKSCKTHTHTNKINSKSTVL